MSSLHADLNACLDATAALRWLGADPRSALTPALAACPVCRQPGSLTGPPDTPDRPAGQKKPQPCRDREPPPWSQEQGGRLPSSLHLYRDRRSGGLWAACRAPGGCGFAGDLIELTARTRGLDLPQAVHSLAEAGLLGNGDLRAGPDLQERLERYQRLGPEHRTRFQSLWSRARSAPLSLAIDLEQGAVLRSLGVRQPGLCGVAKAQEIERTFRPGTANGRGTGRGGFLPVFAGGGWKAATFVPLCDLPGRISGLWLCGRTGTSFVPAHIDPRTVSDSSLWESFCRQGAAWKNQTVLPGDYVGAAFLDQIPLEGHEGRPLFLVADIALCLGLWEAATLGGGRALPLLGLPRPERGLPGVAPEVLGGRALVWWGDPRDPGLLAAAFQGQGRLCSALDLPRPPRGLFGQGQAWLKKVDRQARPWGHWIDRLLQERGPLAFRQLLRELGPTPAALEGLNQGLSPEGRRLLQALQEGEPTPRLLRPEGAARVSKQRPGVLEKDGCWYIDRGGAPDRLLSRSLVRIDRILEVTLPGPDQGPVQELLAQGRILRQGECRPFLEPLSLLQKRGFLWLAQLGQAETQATQNQWAGRLLEIALGFQPAVADSLSLRCGFDPAAGGLRMRHFTLGGTQEGGLPELPRGDNPELERLYRLAPGQTLHRGAWHTPLDPEELGRLSSPTSAAGWGLLLALLADGLAPLYQQPRRGTLLADRVYQQLGPALAPLLGSTPWDLAGLCGTGRTGQPTQGLAREAAHDWPLLIQGDPLSLVRCRQRPWLLGWLEAPLPLPPEASRSRQGRSERLAVLGVEPALGWLAGLLRPWRILRRPGPGGAAIHQKEGLEPLLPWAALGRAFWQFLEHQAARQWNLPPWKGAYLPTLQAALLGWFQGLGGSPQGLQAALADLDDPEPFPGELSPPERRLRLLAESLGLEEPHGRPALTLLREVSTRLTDRHKLPAEIPGLTMSQEVRKDSGTNPCLPSGG